MTRATPPGIARGARLLAGLSLLVAACAAPAADTISSPGDPVAVPPSRGPASSKPAGRGRATKPAAGAQRAPVVPPAAPGGTPAERGEEEAPVPVDPSATPISLERARELALENSLPAALAKAQVDEADASARIARAALMPNVGFAIAQSNQTVNLKSQGITLPGLPPLIGPFNSFDARIRLTQSVFNATRLRSRDAGLAALDAAQAQERATRQQLAASTALGYVEALRSTRAVESARANLVLARSLLTLARDQRSVGVATGVDVARAESSVAQLEVSLAQARTSAEQAQLALRRITGLPLGTPLNLVDPLRYAGETPPPADEAIAFALAHREEPRVLANVLRQRGLEVAAARAERYPTVDVSADFGSSGTTPTRDDYGTRSIGIQLKVPVFDSGLAQAHLDGARTRERETELQLRDASKQIEEDVRLALTTLDTASEQVRAAEVALELALRLLRLARDRFASGVADNLEVLDAQTSLVNARNNRVAALGVWNVARINLAGALGRADSFRF